MMSLIWRLLLRSWKVQAVAAAASLASGACGAALIAAIHSSVTGGAAGPPMIGMFGLLVAGKVAGNWVARLLLNRLAQRFVVELRQDLCHRIIKTSIRHLEQAGTVRLLGALVEDILAIKGAMGVMPTCLTNSLVLCGCVAYLAWLSPSMLGPLFVVGVLGMTGFVVLRRQAYRSSKEARAHENQLLTHLRGVAEGSKELQLNRKLRHAFLTEDIAPTAEALRQQVVRAEDAFVVIEAWTHILFYALVGVLIFALPAWRPVDPKVLIGYTLAVVFMMRPLVSVLQLLPAMNYGRAALANLEQLKLGLAEEPATIITAVDGACPPYRRLELVGVTYGHPGGADAFRLGPLDLSFSPGELVFLVGGNGSGKSTLAKLVAGLYVPELGEIRLNGTPIRDGQRDDYRQLFCAVFVDGHLFERVPDHCNPHRLTQAERYLKEFRIAHKVRIVDGVFRTAGLSQGEQRRLALVSAYLEDRPFYIFDEWAAHQDPLFKETFYRKLLPELTKRGKSVLVVSHDDRYFTAADTIVRMEEGAIIWRGRVSSEAS
jgi:putative ATP-binding cassette transporter